MKKRNKFGKTLALVVEKKIEKIKITNIRNDNNGYKEIWWITLYQYDWQIRVKDKFLQRHKFPNWMENK